MLSERYVWRNPLRHRHPAEKVGMCAACLVACLAARSPAVPLGVAAVMLGLSAGPGRVPLRTLGQFMAAPLVLALVAGATVAVSVDAPGGYLWGLSAGGHGVGVTAAGLADALHMAARVCGALACLGFLSFSTPVADLFALAERMPGCGLMAELAMLVYSSLHVMLDTAARMHQGQANRLGYTNYRNSMRSLALLASGLFLRSLQRSRGVHLALQARGYQGRLRVATTHREVSWPVMCAIGIAGVLVLAAAAGGEWTSW